MFQNKVGVGSPEPPAWRTGSLEDRWWRCGGIGGEALVGLVSRLSPTPE